MTKNISSNQRAILLGWVTLILIWFTISHSGLVGKTLIATPSETFDVLAKGFTPTSVGEDIYRHFWDTSILVFSGWTYSLIIGVLIGIIFSLNSVFYSSAEVLIDFFRSIPPVLAFPLLLVAFNYEFLSYKYTIAFGCIPIVVTTVAQHSQSISRQKFQVLEALHVPGLIRFSLRAFETIPGIMLAARLTFSYALIIGIVSEMVFTPRSGFALGALARDAEINFNTPMFYASVLLAGSLGYCMSLMLKRLEYFFK